MGLPELPLHGLVEGLPSALGFTGEGLTVGGFAVEGFFVVGFPLLGFPDGLPCVPEGALGLGPGVRLLGAVGSVLGLVLPPGVGLVVVLEKSTTARIQRWVALAASAMARTVRDPADVSETAEPGIRTIAVRSTVFVPTSPRSHLTR
ncbi:hypothetical protein [Actinomadura spongiicola]|uniref:hypothetical protein n=1 Tax=Actinomadura spongiicola TaxID=2303421 RepID=UPI000E3BDF98|nr:hypothetical protein [Actinomadura spongiicola]